jgi:hypothetical protein
MKSDLNPARVLIKALCLFIVINFLYAFVAPQASTISGYNSIFPGRTRLPFGTRGDPYSVTVDNVDIMFASHLISAPKQPNEYRVVLLGDSAVWGEGLGAHEVISEQWNQLNVQCGNKFIRTYDLGYPHPSLMKDLVILDKSLEYKPDLIVWFVTLNTLMSQRTNPFVEANHERVANLLKIYDISFKEGQEFLQVQPSFYEKTLLGQRSNLARQIKLQMLGIIWTASGADTSRSSPEESPDLNVENDLIFHGMDPSKDLEHKLWFDAIRAAYDIANHIPVLIVNEPIFVSNGANASVRYNSLYPRWAYDQYRNILARKAQNAGWNYLDPWNVVPPQSFSDATLHLSATGERTLIEHVNPVLQSIGCQLKP